MRLLLSISRTWRKYRVKLQVDFHKAFYSFKMTSEVMPCPLADPNELFLENRCRLNKKLSDEFLDSVVLLKGGTAVSHYATDVEYVFRQEPFFHWCFGVKEPDFFGALCVGSGKSILFMPRLPPDYATWMGKLLTPEDIKRAYGVDFVYYTDEIHSKLLSLEPKSLLTLYGKDSDSDLFTEEAKFSGIDKYDVNNNVLYEVMSELRVFKTPLEIQMLRHVSKISSEAHKYVMKNIKPGMREFQGESLFLHYCYYYGGCRFVGYTCICGSGHNGSVLHYGHAGFPNDKSINDGDMCLFDMGGVYMGYLADITASFPVNGKFTEVQKVIYNAVLNSRNAVLLAMKPGISWVDMHDLSMKVILMKLKNYGALQGDVSDMFDAGVGGIFMPHGLGHLLGVAVHDCGGYLSHNPPRPSEPWRRSLRTARVLQPGIVITVEPGCYFIDHLLDRALDDPVKSRFLVPEVINSLRGFGGVRIEDVVLVTETGVDVLSDLPRTIEEIEDFMRK